MILPKDAQAVLAEAADFYYEVAGLYEDEDLDPNDHLEVVKRAFTSSDCDDFAAILSELTGWPAVRASWSKPDWGFGHHVLVVAPDGRYLDVNGWVDIEGLKKRYGAPEITIIADVLTPQMLDSDPDETRDRIVAVIGALPHTPFQDDEFRALVTENASKRMPTPM